MRDKFDVFEESARVMLPDGEYKRERGRKIIRKQRADDGHTLDSQLTPRDTFRISTLIGNRVLGGTHGVFLSK